MSFLIKLVSFLVGLNLVGLVLVLAFAKVVKFFLVEKHKRDVRQIKRNGRFKTTALQPDEYDVIVVGGGPAGGTTAFFCAQTKQKVLLLDKMTFPRSKACTGVLGSPAIKLLMEMGVYQELEEGSYLTINDKPIAVSPDGTRCQGMSHKTVSVDRRWLDARIIQKAVDLGAVFKEGWEVVSTSLDKEAGIWSVTNAKGEVETGRMLVCADGVNSKTAEKLGLCSEAPIGISSITTIGADSKGQYTWSYNSETLPGYSCVLGQGENTCLRYCLLRGSDARLLGDVQPQDLEGLITQALSDGKLKIPEGNKKQTISGELRAACQGIDCTYDEQLVIVGDAAGFNDPLTGAGIHTAMLSAKCAAETIGEMRRQGNFIARNCAVYEDKWINSFGYDFAMGRKVAVWLHRYPILMDAWVLLMKIGGDRFVSLWVDLTSNSATKDRLFEPLFTIGIAFATLTSATIKMVKSWSRERPRD